MFYPSPPPRTYSPLQTSLPSCVGSADSSTRPRGCAYALAAPTERLKKRARARRVSLANALRPMCELFVNNFHGMGKKAFCLPARYYALRVGSRLLHRSCRVRVSDIRVGGVDMALPPGRGEREGTNPWLRKVRMIILKTLPPLEAAATV